MGEGPRARAHPGRGAGRDLQAGPSGRAAVGRVGPRLLPQRLLRDRRYDLSRVGRYKLNRKLGPELDKLERALRHRRSSGPSPTSRCCTPVEVLAACTYLLHLADGEPGYRLDDQDHFANRRIRSVGELIQNQVRIGLSRMERVVRERMTTQDVEAITPQTLINIRPVVAAIKEFFGTSQLSPVHGPGQPAVGPHPPPPPVGARPGWPVAVSGPASRSATSTSRHYGRMCPIETPEGPNIGLIGALADLRPGQRVRLHRVAVPQGRQRQGHRRDRVPRRRRGGGVRRRPGQRAAQRRRHASASDRVLVRRSPAGGHARRTSSSSSSATSSSAPPPRSRSVPPDEVQLMDVSPKQIVSVGHRAHPVPRARRRQPRAHGRQHAEAGRAAGAGRGARTSAPASRPAPPATRPTWSSPRTTAPSPRSTATTSPSSTRRSASKVYRLLKFERSNQDTCINQKPRVARGRQGQEGRRPRRRPLDRPRRAGAGQEPARRLHAVGGLQLRGRHHPLRAPGEGRRAHVDPHPRARDRRPRHQARSRGDHPGHPEPLRGDPRRTSTSAASSASAPRSAPATCSSARSRPRARPSSPPRSACCAPSSVRRPARSATPRLKVPHGERARSSTSRCSAATRATSCRRASTSWCGSTSAQKRKISVGDKLAGRHGNKGVISKILPIEDMPFLADGTPVDIILNPLGVPVPHERGPGARGPPRLRGPLGLGRRRRSTSATTPVRGTEAKTRTTHAAGDARRHAGVRRRPLGRGRGRPASTRRSSSIFENLHPEVDADGDAA